MNIVKFAIEKNIELKYPQNKFDVLADKHITVIDFRKIVNVDRYCNKVNVKK